MIVQRFLKKRFIFLLPALCTTFLAACNVDIIRDKLKFDTDNEGSAAKNLILQDVEAPDVFQVSEAGLWDGRPSLGGIWVAHPDVKMPERVIIQNGTNNKSVVGALFRHEHESAGPKFKVSSEAASALDISATSPAKLTVTALRKRTVNAVYSNPTELFSAETAQNVLAYKKSEKLKKPFIQIGIFNIEKNATNTGASMRRMGITPIIKEQKIKETQFWRVTVGPARSQKEHKLLLKMIISTGFKDAYAVTH